MTSGNTTKGFDIKADLEADGSFKRRPSTFRDTISKGGEFEPEKGRYHLYVSYSCPWATRTLIVRKLKGLEDFISFTPVSPRVSNRSDSWPFADVDNFPGAESDPLYGSRYIKDIYFRADPNFSGGRFTVPVLWDKKTHTIVNNESSEIIRIFNTAFNDQLPADKASLDLYPEDPTIRKEIDELNEWIYETVNNGVYRSGFASSQEAYETAVKALFESLDKIEKLLTGKDYLVGGKLTEADVRLFVTISRFDVVYFSHFKCNLRSIRHSYPAINSWLKKLYWNNDAFKSSTNFDHIKNGYYWTGVQNNPSRIVPIGLDHNIEPL